MLDGKLLSAAIRKAKMKRLKPDLDSAGQEGFDPNHLEDMKQNARVSETLDAPDHEPASPEAMGENESSQEEEKRKKISMRIAQYLDSL